MKLPDPIQSRLDALRSRLGGGARSQALTQFLKPNLGPTPAPLRRVLEPVVAAVAIGALGALLAIGAVSFAALVLVAALAYAIITYVFGVELDLAT